MADWSRLSEEAERRWKQQSEVASKKWEGPPEETSADGILLGKDVSRNKAAYLPIDALKTHMHVVGSTGVGKSYFLEGLIKSLILEGRGICLVDPHGDLYDRVLEFCAYVDVERPDLRLSERVVPFNIAERRHVLGFNPIQRNARVKTYQVVALMEAIRKCWGAGSFQETPPAGTVAL